MAKLRWLFTLDGRVGRRAYVLAGLALALLKYACEALALYAYDETLWTPLAYLSPLHSGPASELAGKSGGLLLALSSWSLLFVWIGAALSLRRARDAAIGGWSVLFFFFPLLNWLLILFLALEPSSPDDEARLAKRPELRAPLVRAALRASIASAVAGVGVVAFCVYVSDTYALSLFFGLPFFLGFTTGILVNKGGDQGFWPTAATAVLALVLLGGALMLLAIEGLVCIAMALPLAAPLAVFGAVFGRAIARGRSGPGLALPALLLPPCALLEMHSSEPAVFEVATRCVVEAPPERVWPHVIGFADLPEPTDFLFRTGVAHPVRARIEGEGVGALRRCEFSTGAFVEPITAWEPPTRLAFDVIEHPPPMHEWSFYAELSPPHLERSFRALRGEFRLSALEGGRTLLEGSTWYRLEIRPLAYWRVWSDAFVHRIHRRVLEHVARLAEGG